MSARGRIWTESLLCAAVLLAPLPASSARVHLQTLGGGSLTGEILRFEENAVSIGIGTRPPRKEVSVPLTSIASVDLPETAALLENPAAVLHLAPLFPFASPALRASLLEGAQHLAENGLWMPCHTWLQAIDGVSFDPPERTRLRLTRARALHALGLYSALKEELTALNEAISPLEAPRVLCLLNAEALLRDTHLEKALYWAQLPSLRLPTESDPHLQQLVESLERQIRASAGSLPHSHR